MARYDTADGGSVDVVRTGQEIEFRYRTACGDTAATVVMDLDDAVDLICQLADSVR